MFIYRKSSVRGLWNRVFVADIEYAISLALNSKNYSIR